MSEEREVILMRKVLFYSFIVIFLLTAVVTIAGITKFLLIESQYLDKLFYALILELVGGVIGLFTTTFKKGLSVEKIGDIEIQLVFRKPVDIKNPTQYKATYTLMAEDPNIEPIKGSCTVYSKGQSLYIKIKDVPLDKILLIEVKKDGTMLGQGSQHLGSRSIELEAPAEVL
jgi:hypothetical protein